MQDEHLQLLRRLAGPKITSVLVSPEFLPFLGILPDLQHLCLEIDRDTSQDTDADRARIREDDLQFRVSWPTCSEHLDGRIMCGKYLASLASLRSLTLTGCQGDPAVEQLWQLTRLKALHLDQALPAPADTSCHVSTFPMLTSLEMQLNLWITQDKKYLWPLTCQGKLKRLALGNAYLDMMNDSPAVLCSLACSTSLEHLHLNFCGPFHKSGPIQLCLPSLLTLSVSFTTYSGGCHPVWDLSDCGLLHYLAFTFDDAEDEEYDSGLVYEERPSMDLSGLTGVRAALLHITFDTCADFRTTANFTEWNLQAVSVYDKQCDYWRGRGGVQDLLGALLGELPMSEVTFNDRQLDLL